MLSRRLSRLCESLRQSNPSCEEWGEEYDPLRALSLFQQAEIGLRIDISKGATYYRRRLTEAIEGQDLARQRIVEKATAEAMG